MPLTMSRPDTLMRTTPETHSGSCSGAPSVMPTRPSRRKTMKSSVTNVNMAHSAKADDCTNEARRPVSR